MRCEPFVDVLHRLFAVLPDLDHREMELVDQLALLGPLASLIPLVYSDSSAAISRAPA
jgi:hypothetical protein